MQISSLFSAVPALLNSGLHLLGVDVSAEVGQSAPSPAGESLKLAASQSKERVDFSSISPDDFSAWLAQLHDSGELPDDAYDDLRALRLELDRRRVPHDEPVDLLDLVRAISNPQAAAEDLGKGNAAELARRQLQWLERFAEGEGIDAVA